MGLCWALEVPCILSAHTLWDEAGRVAGPTRMRELCLHRGAPSAPWPQAGEASLLQKGWLSSFPVTALRKHHTLETTQIYFLTVLEASISQSVSLGESGGCWGGGPSGGARGASLPSPFLLWGPPHSLVHGPLPITPTSSWHCHLPTSSSDLLPVFPPQRHLLLFGPVWILQIVSPSQDT